MTKKILMSISFLALLAAFPAFAETEVEAGSSAEVKTQNTLDRAERAIERTTERAGAAVKDAYADVKTYFGDEEDIKAVSSINVMERLTAHELIGATIENPQGENIGKIEDVLIGANGEAQSVIINDGGVLGRGKRVAFDYDVLEGFSGDKDAVVRLSETDLKNAASFDYEAPAAGGQDVTAMKEGQLRVSKILDAKVVDSSNTKIADVETLAFEGDDADYIIVAFDQVLGLGGEQVALDMEALDLVEDNGKYTFKLNAQQTAQFQDNKNMEENKVSN